MKDFQVTFQKYVELIKRIESVEQYSFNKISSLVEQVERRDLLVDELKATIRFQRNLIHKKIIKEEE